LQVESNLCAAQLGFTGVAVTDWQDIEKLTFYHNVAATPAEAIMLALDAGVDMSMVWRGRRFLNYTHNSSTRGAAGAR
jgi:beta-glucosidase